MKGKVVKNAILNAVATAVYVAGVASFLFYAPKFFGPANTVLLPIAILLLFVFSAALTGLLIFGRPTLWYLGGNKKEALSLITLTLVALLIITLIALSALILYL